MMEELRCYTFTNWMLRPIQQGIQPAHASMELFNKYLLNEGWQNGYAENVADWSQNHKTMICLNGGNAKGIREWLEFFNVGELNGHSALPFAPFYEDEQSLDGGLTSVAVILPARIFDGAAALRRAKYDDKVNVTWDHLLKELRLGWTDNDFDSQQFAYTYNEWERDLMNKLNGCQLAT